MDLSGSKDGMEEGDFGTEGMGKGIKKPLSNNLHKITERLNLEL